MWAPSVPARCQNVNFLPTCWRKPEHHSPEAGLRGEEALGGRRERNMAAPHRHKQEEAVGSRLEMWVLETPPSHEEIIRSHVSVIRSH